MSEREHYDIRVVTRREHFALYTRLYLQHVMVKTYADLHIEACPVCLVQMMESALNALLR